MKKIIKNSTLFLTGITVAGLLLFGSNAMAGGDEKNKQERKPWPCPEQEAKMSNPIKPDAGILDAGKQVWNQNCKSCHGKAGKGDGVKAKNIDISPVDFTAHESQQKSDGELFWKTKEGRKPMPSFELKLSDIERWSVIQYIRTLSANQEPNEITTKK